ncbi:hypothetical protein N7E81_11225 [Reichenbachiella carrageenanivorans]|uniref:Translation initiation factor IF-2 n=1 Tax=Reichenbachiella carrageenanivorans TaxID=2979869 RepID=A0ABY6CVK4_9BACT|nr:hypothetical protein [Reichenbachiella carrageenanivorans]UXX77937.1 hypothetical protein N7E81_11225 [Reichenbachiella carrageenanivorans]
MRLGTLARKISITPSKLTAFLEAQAIDLSSGTNTKLTEEQIELVLAHFKAELPPVSVETPSEKFIAEKPSTAVLEDVLYEKVEDQTETKKPEVEASDAKVEPAPTDSHEKPALSKKSTPDISESFAEIALPHELDEELETEESSAPIVESVNTPIDTTEKIPTEKAKEATPEKKEPYESQVTADLDPEIESYVERLAHDASVKVIKPPKVKLQGLTVKGKIELPEPKTPSEEKEEPKKETPKAYDPDEIITTTGPKRDRKRKPKNYKGKKYNKDYNPVEAARKKKEWEEKKRQEQEEKRRKKAKEKHYKKVAAPITATAPAPKRKKKKSVAKKKQKQEQPTGNVLQRFWRWMNT